jgi:hypothetical protein
MYYTPEQSRSRLTKRVSVYELTIPSGRFLRQLLMNVKMISTLSWVLPESMMLLLSQISALKQLVLMRLSCCLSAIAC